MGLCLCVCVSVCLSVKSHLTSGAFVRPENTVTYLAGNGGQKICGVFFDPVCENGGTCTAPNTCDCPEGYSGGQCQTGMF